MKQTAAIVLKEAFSIQTSHGFGARSCALFFVGTFGSGARKPRRFTSGMHARTPAHPLIRLSHSSRQMPVRSRYPASAKPPTDATVPVGEMSVCTAAKQEGQKYCWSFTSSSTKKSGRVRTPGPASFVSRARLAR